MKGSMNRLSKLLFFVFLWMASFAIQAQNKLVVPVEFMVENGNTNNTKVKIFKEGKLINSMPGKSAMKVNLNFNSSYLLCFSKDGYITKTVSFVTNIPADRIAKPMEPYKIGVKIFKQYEGVNIVVYNQPVAQIHFNTMSDEFDYDTDYSKSILSELNDAEKQLQNKAAEERMSAAGSLLSISTEKNKTAETNAPSSGRLMEHSLLNKAGEPTQKQSVIKDDLGLSDAKIADKKIIPDYGKGSDAKPAIDTQVGKDNRSTDLNKADDSPRGAIQPNDDIDKRNAINAAGDVDLSNTNRIPGHGFDNGDKIAADAGNDINNSALYISGNTTYFRNQWKEHGRSITTIKVINGFNTAEYRKVNYEWGGIFYFKDQYFTISQNVYQWATGEK